MIKQESDGGEDPNIDIDHNTYSDCGEDANLNDNLNCTTDHIGLNKGH